MERRRRGQITIAVREFADDLNLRIANKTSGPIIRRLLTGLSVLTPTDKAHYEIREICPEGEGVSPELARMLDHARRLVSLEALSYAELLSRLRDIFGAEAVQRQGPDLDRYVKRVSTRTVEHVIAVARPEGESG
jgi:hypothetical protein